MAIIQISKIQQRSGNLVDLPQLDQGEFGWASDVGKLYIGKTQEGGNIENVEVLTSYSNISFSQLDGAEGNLDISNVISGQILTYVASTDTWVNAGGNALDPDNSVYYSNALVHLGDVSTVKLGGGGIGYILETDGAGNLSWTPKGTLYTRIENLTNDVGNGNIITMTVDHETPYINGQRITITGANISNSTANSYINGNNFYVQLDGNFSANSGVGSGNVILYTDSGLTTTANGAGLLSYVANSGVATAVITAAGSGGNAGGANTSVQFNNTNLLDGSANFTFDFANNILSLNGNANVGNLNATSSVRGATITSTVSTGTAPLTVTSTTRVANLNVDRANISEFESVTTQTTGTFYPTFVNGNTTANYALGSNANIAFNAATGNLSTTILNANGNVIGGNIYTSGLISAAGNANVANIFVTGNIIPTANVTYDLGNSTNWFRDLYLSGTSIKIGTQSITSNTLGVSVSNAMFSTTVTATGNITANYYIGNGSLLTGIVATVLQNGNSNVSIPSANGNINLSATGNANILVVTGTGANITGTLSVSGNANIGNIGTGGLITVTGNVTAGNLVTAGQVSAGGNASVLGIKTDNYYYANGTPISFAGSYSNSNVANYLPIYNGNVGGGTATFYGTVLTTGANSTAGTITGNWSLSTGSRLQATYADLAEYYEADENYGPGTVLEFGGEKEVTLATDGTTRVAGVVSTNPAYAMNANCQGEYPVAIALQGRVPCKVRGTIYKGDMMVSGGNGYARPSNSPIIGSIIGKALENFNGIEGVIEIAIGRL